MTRVLCASDAAGVALLAAAVDTGRIAAGRAVLLVANEADVPEVVADARATAGFATLAQRFDEVVSWNELIAPLHPSAWRPPAREVPVLARLLAGRLAAGDAVTELIVESVTTGPGRTLAALVPDVPITVAAHTLAAYAPPLVAVPSEIEERVTRLLHLDLVSDLAPQAHADVVTDAVSIDSVRSVLAAVALPDSVADAIVLDERHSERGLLGVDGERAMWLRTVAALVAGGHRELVFAPHPSAQPVDHRPLVAAAREVGARLTVGPGGLPHEAWAAGTTALVVGSCSAALMVARRGASVGSQALLGRPVPDGHPDRSALRITDALLPRLHADGSVTAPAASDVASADVAPCPDPARASLDLAGARP